jgi:uncharacterized protein (DUF433 family)
MKTTAVLENKDVVRGSRVPIKYLLDYIKDGYSISDFLASYPWLKKKDVENALDEIKKRDFTASYAL